jgi:dipeptide/tripeptide permease
MQSLWLLLAAACALLTYRFPFYSGNTIDQNNQLQPARFIASFDILINILTAIIIVICLVTIFLFKNRKLQLRLTIFALVVSILNIILYFNKLNKFIHGELSLSCIFAFLIPIFLFLAARGIWRDEKLIKSLDRLR